MSREPLDVSLPSDLDSIVRIREGESDPVDLGLSASTRDHIWNSLLDLYRTRRYPAIALCVRHRGKVLIDRTIGHARGNAPLDPPDGEKLVATPDTPFCQYSASKGVTAMVIHLLDDRGLLHVDDRIVDYLPEYGAHGKHHTTIRHVLTHRAGLPSMDEHPDPLSLLFDREAAVAHLCRSKPSWVPGRRLAYHAVTGGFILGGVVERVTGKDIGTFLREEIAEPLGLKTFGFGLAEAHRPRAAVDAFTGRPLPFPLAGLAERALGVPFEAVPDIANTPEWMDAVVPAGNLYATADEINRFYQLLLDGGSHDGREIFRPRTIRRAVVESSWLEPDLVLVAPIRYGGGLMLGGEYLSLYGMGTPAAYGHLGYMNTITWADPERQMSAALLTSGKPFMGSHLGPLTRFMNTLAKAIPRDETLRQ